MTRHENFRNFKYAIRMSQEEFEKLRDKYPDENLKYNALRNIAAFEVIDLSHLNNGVYFLNLKGQNKTTRILIK